MKEYYRVYAQVNLDYIAHNIRELNKIKNSNTEIMGVIKADGYGHGAIPIAKTLLENNTKRFAVAVIEEAIALRKSGITKPIHILGFTPDNQLEQLIHYDLIQTIFKYSMAKTLSDIAVRHNKRVKIHIKIDTGMGRIGFFTNEESIQIIKSIHQLPNIYIEGIFTHFAKADELDKGYTYEQLTKFNNFVKALEKENIHIPIKHAANSAGLIDVLEAHLDYIRVGIALYGLYPSQEVVKDRVNLKQAITLKSHIIFIKEVDKGTSLSYGGTYITKAKSKIATIPVGYGDGYPRALSSKGRVLIRGEYAPIVGRICMDQFMVDVTHIKDVEDSDEVVLIGEQAGKFISVDEIARLTNTINYEITCGLGKRIPRVYKEHNRLIYSLDYFGI